jgi:alpha-beta hydrolase superfamily lysophospholipase
MSAPRAQRALYLQGAGPATFAVLHTAEGCDKHTAVLLCPPFGWEDMCSYRIRREWAERLAAAGHTTLRIDLPGSGDSAGGPHDPGQLDAWTQAVDGAAWWLRKAHGAERVAVIGIGLGGIVSLRAAVQGAPIDELVLWSVPARGRGLVRELRTFSRLELANRVEEDDGTPRGGHAEDGAVFANGYLLSAETVLDLERLDLRELERGSLRRVLLLGRDGLKVDSSLSVALERSGTAVKVADGPGFGAMMVEAQDARPPLEVFELVGSWLAEGEPGAERSDATSPVAQPVKARSSLAPAAASSSWPGNLVDRGELRLDCSGVALRERPLFLDGPSGRLFGVLTEPLGTRRQLTALLLNAGPQRRTGPNRMWVEIARRWAAKGVPTLRLDADGIGDADGDAQALGQVTAFYRPTYVEQARAALEALAQLGLPPRFLTLGLCSGAYWSAHAALADERVAAAIMLNPRTLVFDEWRHAIRRTRLLKERALMASTWRKLLRGEIKLAKHLETGRTLVERAASAPLRVRASRPEDRPAPEQPVHQRIEALFDGLRDRGQHGLLLFTGKEVLRDELSHAGVFERMNRWPNLEIALLETSADTHTLTPLWLQRQVGLLVDRVLEDELRRQAA